MREARTRRTVVRLGAASIAAAALGPRFSFARSAARRVRVGIVGGNFGRSFYFHEHPDCVVEAVSDLRPERRAALMETYRCAKPYDSLEELIRDREVDAVAIFTPAPDHVRHVVATLKAGKHALSAVPAAMSLEECSLLLDTVKSTGLTYMMAETSYYQQPTISARRRGRACRHSGSPRRGGRGRERG